MKEYRLLKDLPFAKAGEILELWDDGTMAFKDYPSLPRFDKKDVRMFPHWFEKIETYYLIDGYGRIQEEDLWKTSIKDISKSIGNYFETEEEAEKHLEWLKARAVLLEDTKGKMGDFYVGHDWGSDELIAFKNDVGYTFGEISFYKKEDAQASIDKHEREWKIYLGVE